ncbi:MAG: PAS domain S-box protein, partial [Syntrophobacteraceae bacterium]
VLPHTLLFLFVYLAALGAAFSLARKISRAVERLRTHVSTITDSDTLPLVPSSGIAEFEELGQAVNDLVAGILSRESALREREEQFRLFLENSPTLAWMKDDEGRYVYVSKEYEQELGLMPKDWISKTDIEIWPNEIAEQLGREDLSVLHSGRAMEFALRITNCDGLDRTLWNLKFPIKGTRGKQFIAGIGLDITERKRAEETSYEKGEQLRLFIENAPVSMAMFDREMRYLSASRGWMRDYALGERDLRGMNHYEVFPEIGEPWRSAHRKGLAGEVLKKDEDRFVRADGSVQWIRWEVRPWRNSNGDVAGIIIFTEDITERKDAEERLHIGEEQFRALVESAPDAIYIQAGGLFAYANKSALRLYGANSRKDLLGKPVLDRIHQDSLSSVIKRIRTINVDRIPVTISEQKHLRIDGTVVEVEANSVPITYRQQDGGLVVLRDITDRKRKQEEQLQLHEHLQHARKVESLGRMAGGIAHHFNNMLGAAIGYLELVLYDLPGDSVFRENIGKAMQASLRAADICRLMQAYLGQTIGTKKPINFQEVCRETLSLLRASFPAKLRLSEKLSSEPLVFNANDTDVRQILTNLVMNACEAVSDRDGTIVVESLVIAADQIREVKLFPPDWKPKASKYLCLSVSDSGCGIEPMTLEKIFDPFFSTKFTGRGLGLSVTFGLVRSYEGAIAVASRPGSGSQFKVFFPLPDQDQVSPCPVELVSRPIPSVLLILLAEDEPMMRQLAQTMLERLGHEVVIASDGAEAMEIFESRMNDFSLALLDISMPRMDGWEVMKAIKTMRPDTPVILASGHDEAQVMRNHHAERPEAFLHKPYHLKDLESAIKGVVRTRMA